MISHTSSLLPAAFARRIVRILPVLLGIVLATLRYDAAVSRVPGWVRV